MTIGFDSVTFSVFAEDDGYLPSPVPADDGPDRYEVSIRINSASDLAGLKALRSVVTAKPAIGFVSGGTVVIEAGAGVKALTYPTADGDEATVDAVLIALSPQGHMLHDTAWRVAATFLVLEEPS